MGYHFDHGFRFASADLHFTGQPEFADLIPDVPAREWKRRRDDWTAVVEQNVLPALNGFTAFISAEEPDVVPHPRDLLQYVPVFGDRLDALVRARLFTEYSARLPESAFRQNASQTVAEFQNWRLTRAGKWKWNKAAAEIAPRLTRRITGRHLTGWKKQ